VLRLANDFGASAVVIVEGRGRHPAELRSPQASACFVEQGLAVADAPSASLFLINEGCLQ
jgi:hypothetical protein